MLIGNDHDHHPYGTGAPPPAILEVDMGWCDHPRTFAMVAIKGFFLVSFFFFFLKQKILLLL
jgi:hypothetical protein